MQQVCKIRTIYVECGIGVAHERIECVNYIQPEFRDLMHLQFADDVVLIGKNGQELSEMAGDLEKVSKEMGLTIIFFQDQGHVEHLELSFGYSEWKYY